MKLEIQLTILAITFSVYPLVAQQIIYGDAELMNTTLKTNNNNEELSEANPSAYYSFDQTIPNTFTSDNNTLVVCHLVHNDGDTNVVCSTDRPKKGGEQWYTEMKIISFIRKTFIMPV